MKLTENFHLDEFRSKDGVDFPQSVFLYIVVLAEALQVIREELKAPMIITSGYRSPEHNKKIGGAANSQHLRGTAVDFKVKGMEPKKVAQVIEQLISERKIPQGGLKAYKSWVHYDIRGEKARW